MLSPTVPASLDYIATAVCRYEGIPIEGAVTYQSENGGVELHGIREEGETEWQDMDTLPDSLIQELVRDAEENFKS